MFLLPNSSVTHKPLKTIPPPSCMFFGTRRTKLETLTMYQVSSLCLHDGCMPLLQGTFEMTSNICVGGFCVCVSIFIIMIIVMIIKMIMIIIINNNNLLTGKLHSLGVVFREVLCIKYTTIHVFLAWLTESLFFDLLILVLSLRRPKVMFSFQCQLYTSVTLEEKVVAYVGCLSKSVAFTAVSLYKCDVGRESCSVCWVSERKLKCGWCRSGDSCTVKRACAEPSKWTNYPQPCNIRPKITKVSTYY